MTDADWVKKINALANEMDEIAGAVHPSVAMVLTADLRKKFRSLAQGDKVMCSAVDILPATPAA